LAKTNQRIRMMKQTMPENIKALASEGKSAVVDVPTNMARAGQ
jgi:hypothetical protein